MTLLAIAASVILGMMMLVAVTNLLTAPRLENAPMGRPRSRISLLIPARNEEANLRQNLASWLSSDHPDLDIIVLDDESTDSTRDLVGSFLAGTDGRLRLVAGQPVPQGWSGKSWACDQLAREATGEILIFCDADVAISPKAVGRTAALLAGAGVDALTGFPRHRFAGWIDRAIVPLVTQLPILTLLPLVLVTRFRSPALSAGNGQWFAFTRTAYQQIGGHAAVRGDPVEDVALARLVKARGLRLLPVLATEDLYVSMYVTANAVRAGFRKNLYPMTGGKPLTFLVALLVFSVTAVYPWVALVVGGGWIPLILLVGVRTVGVGLFRQEPLGALLHPLGSILVLALGIDSVVATRRKTAVWKGRKVLWHRRPRRRCDQPVASIRGSPEARRARAEALTMWRRSWGFVHR